MATKWDRVPKFNDDVVKSSLEDARKVVKDTSNLRGAAVDAVKEAGSRAASRMAGRAGLAAAALKGGYDLGRAIDEDTGIGKKLVDKSGLGDLAAKAATSGDRVTLTKEAQARIDAGELDKKPAPKKASEPSYSIEGKNRPGRNEEIDDETRENAGGYKRGGKVKHHHVKKMAHGGVATASRRADGIASKGHTKGRIC